MQMARTAWQKYIAVSYTHLDVYKRQGIGKENAMIHKAVEHTESEDAAHATALQNKTATVVDTYYFLQKCQN